MTLLRWIETSMDDVLPEDLKSYKLALGQAVIVPYHTKDLEKAVRCRPVLPEDDSSIPEISEHQLIEGGDYILFLKRMTLWVFHAKHPQANIQKQKGDLGIPAGIYMISRAIKICLVVSRTWYINLHSPKWRLMRKYVTHLGYAQRP